MHRIYGCFGLFLILFSFISSILIYFSIIPHFGPIILKHFEGFDPYSSSINYFLLILGLLLFFDSVDFEINGTSIIHKIKEKPILFFYLLFVGFIIGVLTEFFGSYIFKIWNSYLLLNYLLQTNNIIGFLRAIVLPYGFYLMLFYSMYSVFFSLMRGKFDYKKNMNSKKFYRYIFPVIGIIGIVFLIIPVLIVYMINLNFEIRGSLFGFTLIGLWFILEYVEYLQKKRGILKNLFELKFSHLIPILCTSLLVGFLTEFLNVFVPGWKYENYLFNDIKFIGVPIVVLIGWIPLCIICLSFYTVLLEKDSCIFNLKE